MLFSEEIESLQEDGFEGSNAEHQIFMEVFCGNDERHAKKRSLLHSKTDDNKSLCSNSENSAMTSQSSTKDLYVADSCTANKDSEYTTHNKSTGNSELGCSQEFSTSWVQKDGNDINIMRTKKSVDELSYHWNKSLIPLPDGGEGPVLPPLVPCCADQTLRHHLVESSGHGVISSCYVLKQIGEVESGDQVADIEAGKNELPKLHSIDGKKVSDDKSLTSKIDQQTLEPEVFVGGASVVNKCRAIVATKDGAEKSVLLNSEIVQSAYNRGSIPDLRSRLRGHVNHILMATGWCLEKRRRTRGDKRLMDTVYISPMGNVVRMFHKVWRLCGESLYPSRCKSRVEEREKQWIDINEFSSELSNTLSYIEEELQHIETFTALFHQWNLLDPFVTLVIIDRKTSLLLGGRVVKAIRTDLFNPSIRKNILAIKNLDGARNQRKKLHGDRSNNLADTSARELGSALVVADGNGHVPDEQFINESLAMFRRKKSKSKKRKIMDVTKNEINVETNEMEISKEDVVTERTNLAKKATKKLKKNYEINVSNDEAHDKFSPRSFQHPSIKQPEFRKNGLVMLAFNTKSPKKHSYVNGTDDTFLHSRNGCLDRQTYRKITKPMKSKFQNVKRGKTVSGSQIDDDDLLVAALIRNNDFKFTKRSTLQSRSKALIKFKSQKGSCRLLPRNPRKGGKHCINGKWSSTGARTVLSWLIDAGVLSLNDVVQYRSSKYNAVVKDGWVTKDGILCKCCNEVLSVSDFKVHADFKVLRPCLNLFLESGKPFTLCHLEAWSAEYKARKGGIQAVKIDELDQNDDSCGLCGDGGELICCDNCPSTFHQTCLSVQDLPDGNWYCPSCTCQICEDAVREKEAMNSFVIRKCSQCKHKYHGACLKESSTCKVDSDTWFCGANCQEIFTGLRSRVGISNLIPDGYSWALLRCIPGDQNVHSSVRLGLMAECNSRLAVALTIMEECFLPMVDPRTGIDMIPQVLYNWGSTFARLNYEGFYTAVLEKGDGLISVACIRVHGTMVAELPLIATSSENRRQGMCRRLINAIEEMLKSLKIERLVVAAIPSLVDTWTVGFGFEPMEHEEKEKLNSINLMIFPGTTLLIKRLYQKEDWDIKQAGPIDLTTSCRTGTVGTGIGGVETTKHEHTLQSAPNHCAAEVDVETTTVLEFNNVQLDAEPKSKELNHFSRPSSEESTSTSDGSPLVEDLAGTSISTPSNVECCRPSRDTSDVHEGIQLLSAQQ
ncbi:hypothetical protein GIB67_000176 [Kingdonia uniflora]|uniref:Increased DNA methylation 1 n=1 Tax=Kingdonia uniflora TaxID=39325 RepID=A0A7J7P9W8_9MAGN|nr:hypothetical protein GIB67_000176 [Kingdonia uniflora]